VLLVFVLGKCYLAKKKIMQEREESYVAIFNWLNYKSIAI
jgi:hypothetical protein